MKKLYKFYEKNSKGKILNGSSDLFYISSLDLPYIKMHNDFVDYDETRKILKSILFPYSDKFFCVNNYCLGALIDYIREEVSDDVKLDFNFQNKKHIAK